MFIYIFIFSLTLLLSINFFLIKQNFLIDNNSAGNHKISLINTPLSGGIFFFCTFIVIDFFYELGSIYLYPFYFSFILLGILADNKVLNNPKIRFILQLIITTFFVYFSEINIENTRIYFLDDLLKNNLFNNFFLIFCFMTLLNGSNFIDGLNGLMLGYFSSIIFIILNLDFHNYLEIEKNIMISLIIVLFYLFILNINNKLFMGDSGSYVLGLICGYFLIKIYEVNQEISPYFIILLLWYPCFENLFSIIRKFSLKRSPINADNNHFHQLVFFYIKKKIDSKKMSPNNISSYLIILYNLSIFAIGSNDPSNTQLQIILIIFNIIIYLLSYFKLFIFKHNLKFYN